MGVHLTEFRNHAGDYDLVVLDVNMPELNGIDCWTEMRSIRHEVRAVFVTGHGHAELQQHVAEEGAAELLRKPFTLTELSQVVARALARAELHGS